MSFEAIDKYTKIWEIFSSLMNIEFDSVHISGDEVNTNFQRIMHHISVCH